jgi:hypothetical protein
VPSSARADPNPFYPLATPGGAYGYNPPLAPPAQPAARIERGLPGPLHRESTPLAGPPVVDADADAREEGVTARAATGPGPGSEPGRGPAGRMRALQTGENVDLLYSSRPLREEEMIGARPSPIAACVRRRAWRGRRRRIPRGAASLAPDERGRGRGRP